MRREDIVRKFSAFLSFEDRNGCRRQIWRVNSELARHMEELVPAEPAPKEADFLALDFLKTLREAPQANSLAGKHLSAYLQSACLWAAQKFSGVRHKYPLEECFQIACSAASLPAKLLKGFHSGHSRANVESYAKEALRRIIANTIYSQDLQAKSRKFSDYALLRYLSLKELKEALLMGGISQAKLDLYCLAWHCFQEIYQPQQSTGSRTLDPPTPTELTLMGERYSQRRNQLGLPGAPADGDTINSMLATCIQAARHYRTRNLHPLEDYKDATDPITAPWDRIIQEEEWNLVQEIVSKLLAAMPARGQTMLQLWLGLELLQSEILTVLREKYPDLHQQYQVSRELSRYTKALSKGFAREWNQKKLGVILDEKSAEYLKDSLKDCLRKQSKIILCGFLERLSENLPESERGLLYGKFAGQLNAGEIAGRLSIAAGEAERRIDSVQSVLTNAFQTEVEKSLELCAGSLRPVSEKIAAFVEEWLSTHASVD